MDIIVQIGLTLTEEADSESLAAATRKFVEDMRQFPGFKKSMQLLNPSTRHLQGLFYFEDAEASERFLGDEGRERLRVFNPLIEGEEFTIARLAVIE